MQSYNEPMSNAPAKQAKLTIVPTPIGNLGDITLRAIETLKDSDAIYAEDTRVTQKLINALGIKTNAHLFRLDENTMGAHALDVAKLVEDGKNVAYCSDAGMPGVSDPGMKLVACLREKDIPVEVLPGASASIVAYVSSSTENTHFYFGGFLPRKESQCRLLLESLAKLDAALVFYESPIRLSKALNTIASVFPYRKVTVCRELTKLHEEVVTANSKDIARIFRDRDEKGRIKGECAIVIDGPVEVEAAIDNELAKASAQDAASKMIEEGASSKEVVSVLMGKFNITKNDAYEIFLEKKKDGNG